MTSDGMRSAAQPDPGSPRANAQGTPAQGGCLELQGPIEQRIAGYSRARGERRSDPRTSQSVTPRTDPNRLYGSRADWLSGVRGGFPPPRRTSQAVLAWPSRLRCRRPQSEPARAEPFGIHHQGRSAFEEAASPCRGRPVRALRCCRRTDRGCSSAHCRPARTGISSVDLMIPRCFGEGARNAALRSSWPA